LITKGSPYIPIEEIYELLKTPAEITGGVLEEEGARAYMHWPKKPES
jgi:hypothetical protein